MTLMCSLHLSGTKPATLTQGTARGEEEEQRQGGGGGVLMGRWASQRPVVVLVYDR